MDRRPSDQLGKSFTKWGRPAWAKSYDEQKARERRAWIILFWMICIDLGAALGLIVSRILK